MLQPWVTIFIRHRFPCTFTRRPRSLIPVVPRSIKAVVGLQRIARGFVARNRVAGRREAVAILRSACLGVAMDVIDGHIRQVYTDIYLCM